MMIEIRKCIESNVPPIFPGTTLKKFHCAFLIFLWILVKIWVLWVQFFAYRDFEKVNYTFVYVQAELIQRQFLYQ